ncbi:deoxynucleoside kinase-like [Achroia grisella]|uniref:deoxynucleoside kinase-like n=1 Tax=Achroia grisella TaxID=688607 RepID=UPI0027D283DE|nr:deoxynucleoside kinase-like [Achroia grisella]
MPPLLTSDKMPNMKTIANTARVISKRPFKVSIEGNIGSGKSTCINFFNKFHNVEKHSEPLHEWRNVNGHNLLGMVYSDIHKWTYPFQHYVHLSRLKIQMSPPSTPDITVKMFERSVQNSRYCFVENARRHKFLEEPQFHVLNSWYEFVEKNLDINLDLIVYLKTSPQVVWERMLKRGRAEESEVPLEYLQQVHESYENWINSPDIGCEVLTIDADRNLDLVKEDLERYTYKILGGNHTN